MNEKALVGLKKWAKGKKHGDIADSLMARGKEEDSAHRIASWIQKQAGGKGVSRKGGCSD